MWKQLRREDYAIARCAVVRPMREMGLHGVVRGPGVDDHHGAGGYPRPSDLVERRFFATLPNQL